MTLLVKLFNVMTERLHRCNQLRLPRVGSGDRDGAVHRVVHGASAVLRLGPDLRGAQGIGLAEWQLA